ncbi:MAG TPA: YebC/PmpR family DNA-binding transcriptional regulator [Bdellovibrionales bacterium]|nr:YebC/PmpR family DNA-binding transcriptional regulator [Bdellovibrionales bacterium]
MGAQWKHAGKSEKAASKGAVVHKLTKEIQVAAKLGDPNPENNPRLRAAVAAARKASVNRDTIERAIRKGAGLDGEGVTYESVTYEGFAPHKVPVIVECLTDNKNRTASEVRMLFNKGTLGAVGSVGWMFDRVGTVEATHADKNQDIEAVAIEAGAQNVEALEKGDIPEGHIGALFICDPTDLDSVNKFLTKAGWTITSSELSYLAKSYPELSPEQRKEVSEFLNDINEFDDVHRVYAAIK